MLKRYTFWTKLAAVFQILSAAAHSMSFLKEPEPANEHERQMIDLMTGCHMKMGGGFEPTMYDILNALSACFPLFYLLGAVVLFFLLRKNVGTDVMRGMLTIQVLFFGFAFALMAWLTFPPPIIMTGLVFLFLLIARVTVPSSSQG